MLSTRYLDKRSYSLDYSLQILAEQHNIKIGPRQIYRFLEKLQIIDAWNSLLDPFTDNGMFEVRHKTLKLKNGLAADYNRTAQVILVTLEGIDYLAKHLPQIIEQEKNDKTSPKKRAAKYTSCGPYMIV